jgi:RNA polymerase sigma-70 factor (ECF subfamily)
MQASDQSLVEATLKGKQHAFDRLVQKYQSVVYGLAYHWTRNTADAQDLTQDAFFTAYEKLDQLENPARFAGWLRRITVNLCRQWHRARHDGIESIDAPGNERLLDELPHPTEAAHATLEAKEMQQTVAEILELLSPKIRLASCEKLVSAV